MMVKVLDCRIDTTKPFAGSSPNASNILSKIPILCPYIAMYVERYFRITRFCKIPQKVAVINVVG